eukprot:9486637-Alexandrium_andersonii.AAC.1
MPHPVRLGPGQACPPMRDSLPPQSSQRAPVPWLPLPGRAAPPPLCPLALARSGARSLGGLGSW